MTWTTQALAVGSAAALMFCASTAGAQTTPQTSDPGGALAMAPPDSGPPDTGGIGADEPVPPQQPAEPPPPPAPPSTISDQIAGGKLILEARARYEFVDQKKAGALTDNANAYTLRTRIGWETADFHGFKGLIEFEDVRLIGAERFAVNVPGATTPPLNGADKARYPIVNDPPVTELNRAQITWSPGPLFSVTAGRQRVNLDDQRFVGNVGWRQDEQTFDGVRLDATYGPIKGTYVYVSKVNRILGELKDWQSDSHLVNLTWSPSEAFRLQGFVYALDFSNSAANSSLTKGLKASGKTWVGLFQLTYDGTYARQTDYRHNTSAYGLDYWQGDVAVTFDIWTVKVDYASLEGNGTRGFSTPLATTHAFQGWADAWVMATGGNKSFVDGLEDLNVSLNVKPRFRRTYLFNIDLTARYHDFTDQKTGAHLGREWDLQAQAAITPKLTAALKYADFERETTVPLGTATPPASRTKVWFTLEYKL